MAHLHCDFGSECLKMNTAINVVLPEKTDLRTVRVVYLFHGLMDNCSGWYRYSSVERYARLHNVALVTPEVQRSFYTDMALGVDYFRYVSRELPEVCRGFFGFSPEREKNYVMGLSMGGFGALKCALTHPERYAGCGSFSGVTDLEGLRKLPSPPLHSWEFDALLGAGQPAGAENDLFALAGQAARRMPVYLSCGEQDRLYPMNAAFASHLQALGANCRFDHRPGGHTWDFWDRSLQDCMNWLWGM